MPNLLIVAGEASGDIHGAALVKALRKQRPELTIDALGGAFMAEAGARLIYPLAEMGVVGFVEVLSHIPTFLLNFLSNTRLAFLPSLECVSCSITLKISEAISCFTFASLSA